jgi:hypothetical protein
MSASTVAPSPDEVAKRQIAELCTRLMIVHGVQPHVIGAALIANLTLVTCSACPTVADANRAMNEAVKALRSNRRHVPMLVARAAAGRHAAQPAVEAGRQ